MVSSRSVFTLCRDAPSSSPRLPRLQPVDSKLPGDPTRALDISSYQNTSLHHYDENVVRELSIPPQSVHPSATTRSQHPHSNGFPFPNRSEGPTTSSYLTSPIPRNVPLNTFASSPRTHSVPTTQPSFFAQHGLPASLPPPPRTTFYPSSSRIPPPERSSEANNLVSYFHSLLTGSYSQMLAQKPDSTVPSQSALELPSGGESPPAAPRYSSRTDPCPSAPRLRCTALPPIAEFELSLDDMLQTDYLVDNNNSIEEFLTSPLIQDDSPEDTPFLETPCEDPWTSPMVDAADDSFGYRDMPLFGAVVKRVPGEQVDVKPTTQPLDVLRLLEMYLPPEPTASPQLKSSKMDSITPTMDPLDSSSMYTMPQTPAMPPAHLYNSPFLPPTLSLAPSSSSSATATTSKPSRPTKPMPTGTRRNITPAALVPLDAPTQPRQYVTPSATSRKALPAAFSKGKKRARSEVDGHGDDDDPEDDDEVDPTTQDAIEAKRRQNTLAARRSRQRKLQHVRVLEEKVEHITQDRDMWMKRAYDAEAKLQAHGLA